MNQSPQSKPTQRNLLIVFHCGIFFLLYTVFIMSIGRKDVEQMAAAMPPDYIRNMLILLTTCLAGYLGLWNLRRWGLVLVGIGGVALLGYAGSLGVWNPPMFFPILAAITTAPMWPVLK